DLRPESEVGGLPEDGRGRRGQGFAGVVGERGVGLHHRLAELGAAKSSVSGYGEPPVTLSPRLGFARGWRGGRSPYLALTSRSCVGGGAVSGSRRASVSLRSTGTTSPPSSSSWSRTFDSGRPA